MSDDVAAKVSVLDMVRTEIERALKQKDVEKSIQDSIEKGKLVKIDELASRLAKLEADYYWAKKDIMDQLTELVKK